MSLRATSAGLALSSPNPHPTRTSRSREWAERPLPRTMADRPTSPGDDHDGAGRVVRDLAANRTQQELGEPAAAAGPHDEHVGVTRGLDEFFRRIPRTTFTVTSGTVSPISFATLSTNSRTAVRACSRSPLSSGRTGIGQ